MPNFGEAQDHGLAEGPCRSKARKLRRNYKIVKEGNSHFGHSRISMPFFDIPDPFLGRDPTGYIPHNWLGGLATECRAPPRDLGEEAESKEEEVLTLFPIS